MDFNLDNDRCHVCEQFRGCLRFHQDDKVVFMVCLVCLAKGIRYILKKADEEEQKERE
jgi:hypothetical protein